MCIRDRFCIIYWFNPAVWLAGRKMRADRELACDASVLGILQEGCYREYGSVLLHHTANASRSVYSIDVYKRQLHFPLHHFSDIVL